MAVRHRRDETPAARATAVTARHVGGRAGLVDKDQVGRLQLGLAGVPGLARFGHIRPVLLGGPL